MTARSKYFRKDKMGMRPVAIERLENRRLLTFTAPVSYSVGTQPDGFVPNAAPRSIVSVDLDGDGKLDLIVTHTSNNTVNFLKGNGNGTFQPAVAISVGESIQGDVFVGDFNNDGKLDLFLPGTGNQAIILLGNGNGTFQAPINSSSFAVSGYYPRGWVVGDFNNDGKLDVASTLPSNTSDTGRLIVLLGNGNGTFQTGIVSPTGLLGYSRWAVAGDFNHDGNLDLAVADGQGTSSAIGNVEMTILFGNGDGTFRLGAHYASPQLPDSDSAAATSNPEDVVIADVNGDGKPDVIESDYDNTINLFLGNDDGTFQAARSISPGNYPRDVIPVDLNHDGKIDLVVTNVGINQGGALFAADGAEPGSVSVLMGNGDGTFQAPITYGPSAYPGWATAGDFNGDGYADLAVTQTLDGHAVKVYLDEPTSTNLPPTFVNSPSASPATVASGNSTALSAFGADDGGESNLTYVWSTVGTVPAAVSFSSNGTNASKNTTATFSATGTYLFQCAVTDAGGLTYIDLVPVQVNSVSTTTTTLTAPVATAPGTGTSPGPVLTTLTPTFTWTAVSNVTGYLITLFNQTTQHSATYQTSASATSFTLPAGALTAGDSYVWNVRGVNGTQNGPPSNYPYFQAPPATVTTTLTAPVALAPGTSASPGPVLTTLTPTFTWTAVSNVTGYQINLFNQTTQQFVSYQTAANATSFTLPAGALAAGDSYVWNVRGLNGTQSGPPSNYLYFQAPPAIVTPTLAAPVAIGPGGATSTGPVLSTLTPTFTWTAISGVTGYQINLYNQTTKKSVSYQTAAGVTSFTLPAGVLVNNESYVWNVRGLNGTQSGPPSNYLFFVAPPPPHLAAPTATGPGTTASPGPILTTLSPTFAWTATAGATGYQLTVFDLTTSKSLSFKFDSTTTSFTIPIGTIAASHKFVWNVRILQGTRSGPPSNYLYFQTPTTAAAVSTITATLKTLSVERAQTLSEISTASPTTARYAHFMHKLHAVNKEITSLRKQRNKLA